MTAANSERVDAKTKAIEDALSRLGEPVTEAQARALAAREDCDCKEGMFALAATRRTASFPIRGRKYSNSLRPSGGALDQLPAKETSGGQPCPS